MTEYTVRAPDGKMVTLQGPAGASQADVIAQAQKLYKPPAAAPAPPQDKGYFGGMGDRFMAPIKQAAGDVGLDYRTAYGKGGMLHPDGGNDPTGDRTRAVDRMEGDLMNVVKSPVSGAISAVTKADTDVSNYATDMLSMVLGGRGMAMEGAGAKAASAGARVAQAAKPLTHEAEMAAQHAGHVKMLEQAGVEMTAGQRAGGVHKMLDSGAKSNPYTREGMIAAEDHSIRSMNKALYDKALKPIGEKYEGSLANVGRQGYAQVEKKASAAYNRLKPNMKMQWDDKLAGGIAEAQGEVMDLSPATQQQFQTILESRVLGPLKRGPMDGETYMRTQERLGKLAADYRGSRDPEQRMLGNALADVNGHLADALERGSAPAVRGELKRANQAWAMVSRLRDAASRRTGSAGVFSTGDLLAAVKRGDKSVGKGAFARGDALLGDFADAAHAVLPDKIPDSGTALRTMMNGRGLIGAGIGGAVGHIPGALIGGAADIAASTVTNKIAKDMALRGGRPAAIKAARAMKPERGQTVLSKKYRPAGASALVAGAQDQGEP